MTFAEKAVIVFKHLGYSEADIEEAKDVIRSAWPDTELRRKWIDWINKQVEVCW